MSKSRVKAVTVDSDTSDYQPHDGVPGFDVEAGNDSFWVPIAHPTHILGPFKL